MIHTAIVCPGLLVSPKIGREKQHDLTTYIIGYEMSDTMEDFNISVVISRRPFGFLYRHDLVFIRSEYQHRSAHIVGLRQIEYHQI